MGMIENRNDPACAGRGANRRQFITGGAAAIAAPFVLSSTRALASGKLVFVSWGGSLQEAIDRTILATFAKETGIEVVSVSGPDLAKLKAQVQTGNIEWSLFEAGGPQVVGAAREGLLEKIDYSIVDASDLFVPASEVTLPFYSYSGGIAYDPKRHGPGKFPRSWEEFWDVESFPGRRGLRTKPDETMELALLADGVLPKELYPLDVDRAFRSLERIKPYVAKWIDATPQTISLVQNNEVDFVYTYLGRVHLAQQQGISIEYVLENNLVTPSYLGVPKGAKNKDAVMQLINAFIRPDLQAAFCNEMNYTPMKRSALQLLDPAVLAAQPDLDDDRTAIVNVEWWAENFAEVSVKFKEFLLR